LYLREKEKEKEREMPGAQSEPIGIKRATKEYDGLK
jgi:hypothetical protein